MSYSKKRREARHSNVQRPGVHCVNSPFYGSCRAAIAKNNQPPAQAERLEARLSPEAKALCRKAARIQCLSLTDFVANSALEAAKRTLRESELLELAYKDRVAFVEALLKAPATPNARLRKAARRHAVIFRG